MQEVFIALISILSSVVAGLIAWVSSIIKSKQKQKNNLQKQIDDEKKRNDQYKELINYMAGAVDIVLDDAIKMQPDIRAVLQCASDRYHSLDLTPTKKGK